MEQERLSGCCNTIPVLERKGVQSVWKSFEMLFCVFRVKHAVSEDTEVFQGEGLGKTPDG